MARRRQTHKSYWFLKTVILLCISFGIWYLSQHPDILRRKKDAPPPPEPEIVQTIPEPEVIRPGKRPVTYTIRNPHFVEPSVFRLKKTIEPNHDKPSFPDNDFLK